VQNRAGGELQAHHMVLALRLASRLGDGHDAHLALDQPFRRDLIPSPAPGDASRDVDHGPEGNGLEPLGFSYRITTVVVQ
jgi:hypothetical protein